MGAPKGGGAPSSGVASIIDAADRLAQDIGPVWGLVFLIAILVLIPKWGLAAHLATLWKEDRADARKRKTDSERLNRKLSNRAPAKPKRLTPPAVDAHRGKEG